MPKKTAKASKATPKRHQAPPDKLTKVRKDLRKAKALVAELAKSAASMRNGMEKAKADAADWQRSGVESMIKRKDAEAALTLREAEIEDMKARTAAGTKELMQANARLFDGRAAAEKETQAVYTQRNRVAIALARAAHALGYDVWSATDPCAQPGFRWVLFIAFPNGQVSWHLPDAMLEQIQWAPVRHDPNPEALVAMGYDGHSNEEKDARLQSFAPALPEDPARTALAALLPHLYRSRRVSLGTSAAYDVGHVNIDVLDAAYDAIHPRPDAAPKSSSRPMCVGCNTLVDDLGLHAAAPGGCPGTKRGDDAPQDPPLEQGLTDAEVAQLGKEAKP